MRVLLRGSPLQTVAIVRMTEHVTIDQGGPQGTPPTRGVVIGHLSGVQTTGLRRVVGVTARVAGCGHREARGRGPTNNRSE